MTSTGDSKGEVWDLVWKQALFQCDLQAFRTFSPGSELLRGLPAALQTLTGRDFQPLLALRFEVYLELIPVLVECAATDMEPLETFVSGLLRQISLPAFLYGVFCLRAVMTQEDDSSRQAFTAQAKAELVKATGCCRCGSEGEVQAKEAATRYALMLVAGLKPLEAQQLLDDFASRRDYLTFSLLAEYIPVTTATFQKLIAGVSPASPAELYIALHRAVLRSGRDLLPADLLKVTPVWISMVGKVWRLHQGRAVPVQQLLPLLSYLRIRTLLPQDQAIREHESKAVVASLALIGGSLPLPNPQMWLELAYALPGLSKVESLQKLIGPIGKLVAGLLACSSESVHIATLKGLKEFVESAGEGLNLAGLIPEGSVEEVMEYFETGKIGNAVSVDTAASLLRKYATETKQPGNIPWNDVATSIRQLQTSIGLPPLPILPSDRIRSESLKALDEIRRTLT